MSDQIDRTLRTAMGTIVEVAPDAPELPPVSSAAPTRSAALRYVLAGFAITALFAVIGLLLFDRDRASPADTTPIDTPARPADLLLFPQEGVDDRPLGEVTSEIRSWNGIEFVSAWTGEEAYQEYLRQFPDERGGSSVHRADFPGSIRVWTTDGFDEDAIRTAAAGWGYEVSMSRDFVPLLADRGAFDPEAWFTVLVLDSALPDGFDLPLLHIYGTDISEDPLRRLWIEETDFRGGIPSLIPDESEGADRWEPLDAPSGTAVMTQGSVGPMVLWQPEAEGPVVRVSGLGISTAELLDIAFSLEQTTDGWLPTDLPEEFHSLYARSDVSVDRVQVTQFVFDRDQSQPTLWLQQDASGTESPESALFGMVGRGTASGEWSVNVTNVRGHTALRLDYPEGSTRATFLTWAEGPDHLVTVFITGMPVDTALDAIHQLSMDQWKALRQRRPGSGETSPTTTMAPTTTTADR